MVALGQCCATGPRIHSAPSLLTWVSWAAHAPPRCRQLPRPGPPAHCLPHPRCGAIHSDQARRLLPRVRIDIEIVGGLGGVPPLVRGLACRPIEGAENGAPSLAVRTSR